MGFNWDGGRILQDTAIEKKRFIIGEKKSITADIREWISFEDNIIMKEILKELRANCGLPATKNPGDFDKRAMVIWQFVAGSITYVYDTTKYKKGDFWLFPPETYQIKKGDCEDGSFLLASLLIAGNISPFCVRVVLGEVFDEKNKSLGGHCWPVYKNEIGRWCILESTLDAAPALMPEADRLSEAGQSFRCVPYYCFNNYHLWETLPSDISDVKGTNLGKYFQARKTRVNMKMYKGRGHG
ncbi:MAG: transglutaminase domain-containing protein [Nitrospirae bacterium]|nr:transglutaminase domain-containing protein [Nitrospirota bacterium]